MIFLDVDGVPARISGWDRDGELGPACIRVLNEGAVRGHADVVVSSS